MVVNYHTLKWHKTTCFAPVPCSQFCHNDRLILVAIKHLPVISRSSLMLCSVTCLKLCEQYSCNHLPKCHVSWAELVRWEMEEKRDRLPIRSARGLSHALPTWRDGIVPKSTFLVYLLLHIITMSPILSSFKHEN